MATLRLFRDSLAVDDTLFERLAKSGLETHPGDTLVLGAASCTLTSLSPAVGYVILVSRPPGTKIDRSRTVRWGAWEWLPANA